MGASRYWATKNAAGPREPTRAGTVHRNAESAPQNAVMALVAERERRRIADYLHDTTVQDLVAASIMLDLTIEKDSAGELVPVSALLDAALRQLRSLVVELGPSPLPGRELFAAVEEVSRQLSERWRLAYRCRLAGEPARLPEPFANLLLAAARELITNVGRHAHARGFDLTLCCGPRAVMLTVRDDGHGLRGTGSDGGKEEHKSKALTGGFGLHSLRARAMDLGGQLTLHAGESGGMVAVLSLSLDTAAPARSRRKSRPPGATPVTGSG
jgi:two-component system NarL family sensor kinase